MALPPLVNVDRAAAATIRGYLAQAYYSILRWLDLDSSKVMVCEGDEDIDTYLLSDGGAVSSVEQEQIKDLASKISARDADVHESIFNFLRAFHAHDRNGVRCTFVFTTTATLKDQRVAGAGEASGASAHLEIDVLRTWSQFGPDSDDATETQLRVAVVELARVYLTAAANSTDSKDRRARDHAKAVLQAIAYLDEDVQRWRAFLTSVSWNTGSADVASLTKQLEDLFETDPRTRQLPPKLLLPRLLAEVLATSSRPAVEDRALTRNDLERLTKLTEDELQAWCAAHPRLQSAGLLSLFAAVDALDVRVGRIENWLDPLEKLRRRTEQALRELVTHTTFGWKGARVSIGRDATAEVVTMAASGHVVVIGDAGAGKSAVLHEVAVRLRELTHDVVVLSADEVVEFERGADLHDALKSWAGVGPAYLVVDALDSPRDEADGRRMQRALQDIINERGRWNVIAACRTFDLQPQSSFAKHFAGAPHPIHNDPSLPLVRHVKIGRLSDVELERLRAHVPELETRIRDADAELKSILRIPFNLSLAASLVEAGYDSELTSVRTQTELIERYWVLRVQSPSARKHVRENIIRTVVRTMVQQGRLRVDVATIGSPDGLSDLLSAGVLVHPRWTDAGIEDVRLLAFPHRLIFDFCVAAFHLQAEPREFLAQLANEPELSLLSRAGVKVYFERSWKLDPSGGFFWSLAIQAMAATGVREITRVIAPSVAARTLRSDAQLAPILRALRGQDREAAERVLRHLVGALLATARDQTPISGPAAGPWALLAKEAAASGAVGAIQAAVQLLSVLCDDVHALTAQQLSAAGEAARALLAWSARDTASSWLRAMSAQLVCKTFASEPALSAAALRQVIEPAYLQRDGHAIVFRIADALSAILPVDPGLVGDIFIAAFAFRDESKESTNLGGVVLSLVSNRRQDYEGGLYALRSAYPHLLNADSITATRVIVGVIEAYVERLHPVSDPQAAHFAFCGLQGAFVADFSSIWDDESHDNELAMLDAWEAHVLGLLNAGSPEVEAVLQQVTRGRGYAILWRRLLRVARNAPPAAATSALAELLSAAPVLAGLDTSEIAGDLLSHVFARLGPENRSKIERSIMSISVSPPRGYVDGGVTRDRLLGTIGDPALLTTPESRERLTELLASNAVPPNEPALRRPRMVNVTRPPDDWYKRQGADVTAPANRAVLDLIAEVERQRAGFAAIANEEFADRAEAAATTVGALQAALRANDIHPTVTVAGEDAVAAVCDSLAHQGPLPSDVAKLVRGALLQAADSSSPEPSANDASFDRIPSWGESARISAAAGLCAVEAHSISSDADVLATVERLADDKVPAVRFQVARRLPFLRHNEKRAWELAERMCANDSSHGVLRTLVEALPELPGSTPERVVVDLVQLLDRVHSGEGARALRDAAVSLIAKYFLDENEPQTHSVIDAFVAALSEDTQRIPHIVRSRLAISGDERRDAIRRRAWTLLARLTEHAAATFGQLTGGGATVPESESERIHQVAKILDTIGNVLYFASGAYEAKSNAVEATATPDRARYLSECGAIVDRLATVGMPSLAHHLVQLLAFLTPANPAAVFLRVADVVRGAERSGYQYDSLAVKELVELVTHYLADHRTLLRENAACREALLDVLDTFVKAGWPEARALTYRLHEIYQ